MVRDCRHFRHEQTLLNIHLYRALAEPVVDDDDRFAGKTTDAHPDQAIWAHRRRGDFRYLTRVRYRGPNALVGRPYGALIRTRCWLRLHRWLFRPSTYLARLSRITRRAPARTEPGQLPSPRRR